MTSTLKTKRAFTLVEMLTVVAIIAILAGLVVYLMGTATGKAAQSQAKSVVEILNNNIISYKADMGTYPPAPNAAKPHLNSLVYELFGSMHSNGNYTADAYSITATQLGYMGIPGVQNSSDNPAEKPKRIAKSIDVKYIKEFTGMAGNGGNVDAALFVIPQDWEGTNAPPTGDPTTSPIHYLPGGPRNGPDGFDLWGYIWLKGEQKTISNWKQ